VQRLSISLARGLDETRHCQWRVSSQYHPDSLIIPISQKFVNEINIKSRLISI
jgi:hypothetical protein